MRKRKRRSVAEHEIAKISVPAAITDKKSSNATKSMVPSKSNAYRPSYQQGVILPKGCIDVRGWDDEGTVEKSDSTIKGLPVQNRLFNVDMRTYF